MTKAILKNDLLIPAGTEFLQAPTKTERYGEDHAEAIVELTKDTVGSFVVYLDSDHPMLHAYFDVL